MGFSRQEHWSELPALLQRILPAPESKRASLMSPTLAGGFFTTSTTWEAHKQIAAAAAKSLRLCLTLCDPIDGSPPGSPIPGILQARTLEWVAISSRREKYKILSIYPKTCDESQYSFMIFKNMS